MPKRELIDTNKIYMSNNCGPYRIISQGFIKNRKRYVEIEFLNSGYKTTVRLDAAKTGRVKDQIYGIDISKPHKSNSYGEFKILGYKGVNKDYDTLVEIEFLETGNRTVSRLSQVKNGTVKDPLFGLCKDTLYMSISSGPYKIIDVYKSDTGNHIIIEFVETLYRILATPYNAKCGRVYDHSRIMKYNKINNPLLYKNYDVMIDMCLKCTWYGMITRCYNENAISYSNYGMKNVKVDDRWLDVNNFIEDAKTLPQFDKFYLQPTNYQLDKDYKQQSISKNNRVYSINTCMFLSFVDNNNLSIIENRNNHPENYTSRFYNVSKREGKYAVSISIDNKSTYLASFTNEIAAANFANYWQKKLHTYELIPLLNNVEYMSPQECMKYMVNNIQMIIERKDK